MRLLPTCHPERQHQAFGLCTICYKRQHTNRQRAECHPDRPHKARGLCNACYQASGYKDPRAANLRHFYRMTREDEARMLAEQGARCAGCRDEFVETPHVDHDHACCIGPRTCGQCVRGLLCTGCNKSAGAAKDDPARLRGIADYLDRTYVLRSVA